MANTFPNVKWRCLMTQPTANLQPQTSRRAPLNLLALARARDEARRPLTMTAALLYLVLSELGEMGEYPDVAELTAVLNVHRASIWRAEKALQAAGLLTLTMVGKAHSRRKWNYVVGRPDRITFAQQWAWKSMTEPEAKPDDNTPESVEIVPQESPDARVPPVVEAGTTTPPPPRSETPNTPAPARKKKKMDSVVAEWFLANPENMDLYLRFGVHAYGTTT